MLADFCWTLKRNVPEAKNSRKSYIPTLKMSHFHHAPIP